MSQKSPTQVRTGIGRIAFCHLFEPSAMEGSTDKKYSCRFIFKKSDKKTLDDLNAAFKAALEMGVPKHFKQNVVDAYVSKGTLPKSFNYPIFDGDEYNDEREAEGKKRAPELDGCYFINAKSTSKPNCVRLTKGAIAEIGDNDKQLVYSGANAAISVNFFGYSTGSVGVAVGLNNVCVTGGGAALGSGVTDPVEDFADLTFLDDVDDPTA